MDFNKLLITTMISKVILFTELTYNLYCVDTIIKL